MAVRPQADGGLPSALRGYARRFGRNLLEIPPQLTTAGLGCIAIAASSDIANTFDAPRRGGPLVATLLCAALALSFALFVLAARARQPKLLAVRWPWLRWLIVPVLLWGVLTGVQTASILGHGLGTALTHRPPAYGSDDLYYNHYNAVLALRGDNPYTGERLTGEVAYFGATDYTPLRRGRFADPRHYPTRGEMDAVLAGYLAHPNAPPPPEIDPATTHSYPAGAFLVDVPTVWMGIPSVAAAQIALFLVLLAAIVAAAPPGQRLVVALLLLATADGARQVTGGDFEIWPLACVCGAWLLTARRWPSALLLGAACALKQTAWLAAPFYLAYVWRTRGRDEALRRTAIAAGTFLALNAPWIVASPGSWLQSLLLPVTLPLLPDGSGIVGLSLTGALPLAPSWVYGALELAALVIALLWYWREGNRYPYAGLVLALLPLFSAWRSSERYFVLLPLAGVLAAVLTVRALRTPSAKESAAPA